jgi:hypothetical protein
MKSLSNSRKNGLLCFVWIILFFSSVHSAPSLWTSRNQRKMLTLEILKPFFEKDVYLMTDNIMTFFFEGRYPLSESCYLIGELPTVFGKENDYGYDRKSSSVFTIGNPYLGIEIEKPLSPVFMEIGIRVPVDSENEGRYLGLYSDFVDRMEAFAQDCFQVTFLVNHQYQGASGFGIRLRGGMAADFNTGKKEYGENSRELYLRYGAKAGWHYRKAILEVGLSSRWYLSKEDYADYPRHHHQMGFKLGLESGTVQPALFLRLPMDDHFEYLIDTIVGFGIDMCIP